MHDPNCEKNYVYRHMYINATHFEKREQRWLKARRNILKMGLVSAKMMEN